MKKIRLAQLPMLLLALLVLTLTGTPQTAAAEVVGVTPTLYCLSAGCPTLPVSGIPKQANVGATVSPSPSQIPSTSPTISATPSAATTTQPCAASDSASSLANLIPSQAPNQHGHHKGGHGNGNGDGDSDRGGFLQSFFQFFLALMELLVTVGGGNGLALPCSPTISVPPVSSTPSLSAAPTTATTTTSGVTTTMSANWAGYIIKKAPSQNGSITTNWTATKMDCSAGQGHASSWPGMSNEGQNTKIAQVGSAELCTTNADGSVTPSYYGWTESFPNPVATLDTAANPVAIGDQFTATVTFQGGGKFATTLTNKTKGWTINMPMSFVSTFVPQESEVITESSDDFPIVPKFDTITYTGTIYSPDGVQQLPLGTAPNLEKTTNNDANGVLRTDVGPISGDSFSTPWVHN